MEGETYYVVVEGYGFDTGSSYYGHCFGGDGSYSLQFDTGAATGCPERFRTRRRLFG